MAKLRTSTERPKANYTPDPVQRVQQAFRDETDVNRIVTRYTLTGALPPEHLREGRYLDVSSIDFLSAQNLVADMRSKFDRLPAKLRMRFNNSPHQMLRWLEDPENLGEAVRIGLLPESALPPKAPPAKEGKGDGSIPLDD